MTPAPVRPDGRADEHARALVVALDVVTHAAGSAYVELGDTKVSCAVYGPRQHRGGDAPARVDRGALEVDVHAAPFAGKTAGRGGRGEGGRRWRACWRRRARWRGPGWSVATW